MQTQANTRNTQNKTAVIQDYTISIQQLFAQMQDVMKLNQQLMQQNQQLISRLPHKSWLNDNNITKADNYSESNDITPMLIIF